MELDLKHLKRKVNVDVKELNNAGSLQRKVDSKNYHLNISKYTKQFYLEYKPKPKKLEGELLNEWIWGPPGSGKSTLAEKKPHLL